MPTGWPSTSPNRIASRIAAGPAANRRRSEALSSAGFMAIAGTGTAFLLGVASSAALARLEPRVGGRVRGGWVATGVALGGLAVGGTCIGGACAGWRGVTCGALGRACGPSTG